MVVIFHFMVSSRTGRAGSVDGVLSFFLRLRRWHESVVGYDLGHLFDGNVVFNFAHSNGQRCFPVHFYYFRVFGHGALLFHGLY